METEKDQVMSEDILDDRYRKSVEQYLATKHRAFINQISNDLNISWATARKYLDYLESIGRVHGERLGNSIIYFFNGNGEWQDKIWLNKNHILFLDTFISSFGEPFIRIKESKKKGDIWETFGEIMITKDTIGDVIKFLENVKKNISKYGGGKT